MMGHLTQFRIYKHLNKKCKQSINLKTGLQYKEQHSLKKESIHFIVFDVPFKKCWVILPSVGMSTRALLVGVCEHGALAVRQCVEDNQIKIHFLSSVSAKRYVNFIIQRLIVIILRWFHMYKHRPTYISWLLL